MKLHWTGQKSNPEFQSAIVRLLIWVFLASYIGVAANMGYYEVQMHQYYALFGFFLVVFLVMFVSVLLRPVWLERQYLGLAIDVSATSFSIFLTQNIASPIFLFYIWIFVSYGTRYGKDHLLAATLVSIMAYSAVMIVLGGWRDHAFETFFFLFLMIVLPIYQYSLLKKLHSARQEAEMANNARGRFLSTMTHELRTPLSGVIGMANVMDTTNFSPLQHEQLSAIQVSAEKLHRLIGDILDFSQIDAEMLTLDKQPFYLQETISEVVQSLAVQAVEKKLELNCEFAPDLPETAIGDQLRVSQVLMNLLGNAIKFTDKGGILLKVSRQQADNLLSKPYIQLEVIDTGIGIAADKLEAVYDAFRQVDDSNARRFGGTGLGLAISHNLVKLMDGQIEVESELKKGTTFVVRLPLEMMEEVSPSDQLPALKTLLLEFNDTSRRITGSVAARAGLHVFSIKRLSEVTDITFPQDIELLILSDSIEGMNLEDTRQVIYKLIGKTVPVVYLTYAGRKMFPYIPNAVNLAKPVNSKGLVQAVRQSLSEQHNDDHLIQTLNLNRNIVSQNILVAEDDLISAQLLMTLLAREGHNVTLMTDGFTALKELRSKEYDMVFADLNMPDMDGIEMVQSIRNDSNPKLAEIPVIAVTASASTDARDDSMNAGVNEFLTKPVKADDINRVVKQLAK